MKKRTSTRQRFSWAIRIYPGLKQIPKIATCESFLRLKKNDPKKFVFISEIISGSKVMKKRLYADALQMQITMLRLVLYLLIN